ncbi:MAG: aminomethyltransferase family protein [Pyrinomonadaceae bacterium]
MSEVVEQIVSRQSPLHEAHEQAGASFIEREGWLLPAFYGNATAEYSVVRDGDAGTAGLIDLSSRGRVKISGAEAVQFLNGLVTNDVKALGQNSCMSAAFPNAQGRLVAPARILRVKDSFLIDTDTATSERVLKTVERFTLAGDFRVSNIANETALLSVQGAHAAQVVKNSLGDVASSVARESVVHIGWREHRLIIARATHTGEDGFDIFVEAKDARSLWDALVEDGGAHPIGYGAFEMLRIEAGIPRFGSDMDETNVVTEAMADDAVSYQKGCYIGQEIIARIHWRGHVAKKLTGIIFDERKDLSPVNAKIRSADGKDIGRITSQTFSPRLDKSIALGYVKYDYLAPETPVEIVGGDESHAVITGRVAALPFVRGSWHE